MTGSSFWVEEAVGLRYRNFGHFVAATYFVDNLDALGDASKDSVNAVEVGLG